MSDCAAITDKRSYKRFAKFAWAIVKKVKQVMNYCKYYQAQVNQKETWFLVAILRSFEHLCFDRTFDKKTGTFEFFVPESNQKHFLELMQYFINHNIVTNLKELPNRLLDAKEQV